MDRTMTGFASALVLMVILVFTQAASGASVEITGGLKLNGAGSGVVFPDNTKINTALPTVRSATGQYIGVLLGLQRDVNSLEIYVPLLKRVAVLRTNTGHLVGVAFYYASPGCSGTAYAASHWSYAMFRNSGQHYTGDDAMVPLLVPDNFVCQSFKPADGSACVDSADCPSGVVTVHPITSLPFTVPVALPLSFE